MKSAYLLLVLGLALIVVGHGMGLFVAPSEAAMGETGRILYVHVPTAWTAMVVFTIAFVAALGGLWTGRMGWDALIEASAEVGVVFTALLLVQGAVWAKPTWGVYWTWDPRLTTSAILLVLFGVVLLLRHVIEVPERRLTLSAVATIVAFADVPIVYFSVRWWNSLHQAQSTPQTVSKLMWQPLVISIFGTMFLGLALVIARWRIAREHYEREDAAPDLPDLPDQIELSDEPASGGQEVRG